ncbi:unnamed protein product [Dibothriocephalus latus]|uniref:Uncharacterized protein n=1 Tax=Dibothriocephalus latus TaxID=60516 RepID=A0A3P7QZQ2_DIBLA|nr:unnamed protein product [Dibothriocephalus latus]
MGDFFRLASMVVAERTGLTKLLVMLGYCLETQYFVAWCLLQSYLRMDYHFTPYSTVIYLSATQRSSEPQKLPIPPWVLGAPPDEDLDAPSPAPSSSSSSSSVIPPSKRAKKRLAESPVYEVTSD